MEKMSFNDMMARLEKIVATLESGNCSLEDSIKLFEQGIELSKACNEKLAAAEKKITELTQAEKLAEEGTEN